MDSAPPNRGTPVQTRAAPVSGSPVTVSASGATTLYTPAAGKRIRLRWLCLYSDPANAGAVLANVSLGSTNIFRVPFPVGYGAFAHGTTREGPVDGTLSITLSAAQTVYANLDLEEL